MNINEIDNLKKALQPKAKGLLDILKLVKEKKIYPITNENGTIIGINLTHDVTAMNVCKKVCGYMTIGANEAERARDEAALRKFMKEYEGKPVQEYLEIALQLDAADITPVEVIEDCGDIKLVLDDGRTIDRYGNEVDLDESAEEHYAEQDAQQTEDLAREADDCASNNCRGCEGSFQDSQGRWRDCHGRFIRR